MRVCLLALFSLLLLSSCWSFGRDQISESVPDYLPEVPGSAAGPFEHIAFWASGLAGLAFLVGIILLRVDPKAGKQVIVTALSVLVGAQLMMWVSAHLGLITIILLVSAVAWYGYKNRERIKDVFDDEDTQRIGKDSEHG